MIEDLQEIKPPTSIVALLCLVVASGGVAFWLGVTNRPEHSWKVFLVNFLFWSGISISGLVFCAVFELTHARWPGPVRHIAESFAGFLPLSLLLYFILLQGVGSIYPWVVAPPPGRLLWFKLSFFTARDTVAILSLYGLGLLFLLASMRSRSRSRQTGSASLSALSVFFILAYAIAFSLLAIDMVMSLSPYWSNTLFPAYFFMGNLYGGIAAIAVTCFIWRWWTGVQGWLDDPRAHDLGKLLLAFCMLWTYLFWSQYLVIWYGNLPEEFEFLLARTRGGWRVVSWSVLTLCLAIPFVTMLRRSLKRPAPLCAIGLVTVLGVWLERFLLVVPSEGSAVSFGLEDGLITLGFFALFALGQIFFLPFVAKGATLACGEREDRATQASGEKIDFCIGR
ncbi:MAG: hypothetical protein HY644_06610 [Acidobacteria bacterium]|nr:hypothetical protein [Acidobacteriota bacterium]